MDCGLWLASQLQFGDGAAGQPVALCAEKVGAIFSAMFSNPHKTYTRVCLMWNAIHSVVLLRFKFKLQSCHLPCSHLPLMCSQLWLPYASKHAPFC